MAGGAEKTCGRMKSTRDCFGLQVVKGWDKGDAEQKKILTEEIFHVSEILYIFVKLIDIYDGRKLKIPLWKTFIT